MLPREIKMKKAVINVQSLDNACFAWSVVAALHSSSNTNWELSYPHYTVLNLKDIRQKHQFPMTLSQIKKFENLNNISINVYEKQKEMTILPLRLTDMKRDKHVNLLYVQDPQNNNAGHFVWIKNLSRLVSSQFSKNERKKYFCDRYVYI